MLGSGKRTCRSKSRCGGTQHWISASADGALLGGSRRVRRGRRSRRGGGSVIPGWRMS